MEKAPCTVTSLLTSLRLSRRRFVLGTDGIFDCLETEQITEVVAEEETERGERLNAKEVRELLQNTFFASRFNCR